MKVFLSHLAEKKIQLLLEYLEQEWSEQTQKKYLFLLIRKFELISRHPQSEDFPNLYKCICKQTLFFLLQNY
jgi:plasmid stabilization system protein ParE